jgi:class 3 adenylate cyclase
MEQRIQYAKTSDGMSIAFSTIGEGDPILYLSANGFSHIQLEWQFPEMRGWYERLAEGRMLVRFDPRGVGLSQRGVSDFSLDCLLLDLDAVVGHLGLETFALWGGQHSGPVAVAYAVRHPKQVSHLILWCTYARAADFSASPQIQATRLLVDKDWETYSETAAHVLLGWSAGEQAHRFAALIRESTTPDSFRPGLGAIEKLDVSDLLSQVRSPTLVLHRRQVPFLDVNVARGLASRIPGARLALFEGTALAPYLEDTDAVIAAIIDFLGEGGQATQRPEAGTFRTILFTDVEGSTALTQRLGDTRAREVLRVHERIVRDALRAHQGSEVKTMGDGFMVSFSSATRALECAVALQRAFAAHNESADEPIRVRIGLNAGEPIAEEEDLFGTGVILAARIAAKAEGGEILASDVVRQLAMGKGFLFSDHGDVELRGFEDPVRLYEVGWRENG